jgi:phosphoenolpyruvate carboxykinase (GTP)
MWPGYGENMRVLEWIIGRVSGDARGVDTEIGVVPEFGDLNWSGLNLGEERFRAVSKIDREEWSQELRLQSELIERLKDRLPERFIEIHHSLQGRFEPAIPSS